MLKPDQDVLKEILGVSVGQEAAKVPAIKDEDLKKKSHLATTRMQP